MSQEKEAVEAKVGGVVQTGKGSDAPIVSPEQVPDISIDGFEGTIGVGDILRLNLIRFRYVPSKGPIREIVATLSMTHGAANLFLKALAKALKDRDALDQNITVEIGKEP